MNSEDASRKRGSGDGVTNAQIEHWKRLPPLTTREEELKLAEKREKGDLIARQELVERSMKLVLAIAAKFATRGSPLYLDLVQEGADGLIDAVDTYDWRKGCRLSTHAFLIIRQHMSKAYPSLVRPIKLSVPVLKEIVLLRKRSKELEMQLRRAPTDSELATAMSLSEERVRELQILMMDVASLDEPIPTANDSMLSRVDVVPSDEPSPEKSTLAKTKAKTEREVLVDAVAQLPKKQKAVIEQIYGLHEDLNRNRTDKEVSDNLTIGRKTVKNLKDKGLERLRQNSDIQETIDEKWTGGADAGGEHGDE